MGRATAVVMLLVLAGLVVGVIAGYLGILRLAGIL
jgi:hypothetical protein